MKTLSEFFLFGAFAVAILMLVIIFNNHIFWGAKRLEEARAICLEESGEFSFDNFEGLPHCYFAGGNFEGREAYFTFENEKPIMYFPGRG